MRSGSKAKPMFAALGAAAVLATAPVVTVAGLAAADTAPPVSGDPAPDPSTPPDTPPPVTTPPDTPPDDPTPPVTPPPADTPPPATHGPVGHPASRPPSLSIRLALSSAVTPPGGMVTATAWVSAQGAVAHHAVLSMSAPGADVGGARGLGDLGADVRSVSNLVKIPSAHGPGAIRVTATVKADHASTRTAVLTISVTSAGGALPPGVSLPPNISAPGMPPGAVPPGVVPPFVSPPPNASLPLIAAAASPAVVAPAAGPSRTDAVLRNASSALGLDGTMYRMACTDAAWLAALLVGLSAILTQLRLRRRGAVPGK